MSPCADLFEQTSPPADYLHRIVYNQTTKNIMQGSQEKPLDLSLKTNEEPGDEDKLDNKVQIKTEPVTDDIIPSVSSSPIRLYGGTSTSLTIGPSKCTYATNQASKTQITEAKHKNLPGTIQGYSRTHSTVIKKKGVTQKQYCQQSVIETSNCKLPEISLKQSNGQYVHSGLSGGTCKVLSQGDRLLTPPSWNPFKSSVYVTKSRVSPIPTVVQDFGSLDSLCIVPNRGPSSAAELCRRSQHFQNSRNGRPTSGNQDNQVIRNVSDLLKRRNEMLYRARSCLKSEQDRQTPPTYNIQARTSKSPLHVSKSPHTMNTSSDNSIWSSFQYDVNYNTQGGGVTVVCPERAVTVQSRGLSGGTMVSCEPSPESVVAAINSPHSVMPVSNTDISSPFSTNYMLTYGRINYEMPQGYNDLFSPLQKNISRNSLKHKPSNETTLEHKTVKTLPDFKSFTQKNKDTLTNVSTHSLPTSPKPQKSSINGEQKEPAPSTSNLALLSNVCSFLHNKENVIKQENNLESEAGKSPSNSSRSVSPENDLPLKKRKLCDFNEENVDTKKIKTECLLPKSTVSVAQTNDDLLKNVNHCQEDTQQVTESNCTSNKSFHGAAKDENANPNRISNTI